MTSMPSDFFETTLGTAVPLRRLNRWHYRLRDRLHDLMLSRGGKLEAIARSHSGSRRRVLVAGIEVPSRPADIHDVVRLLIDGTRHEVEVSIAPMRDQGKFKNIEAAIAAAKSPLHDYDWLIIVDDDIQFAPRFLDHFIAVAEDANFAIAQPAHALESHSTYAITKRRAFSIARKTRFVEIGPLTLLRRDTFSHFLPFPDSRWCYGIDVLWSEVADREGFVMGIVDGTPIRHLRPVAMSYDSGAAIAEGRELLRRFGVMINRAELFATDEIVIRG